MKTAIRVTGFVLFLFILVNIANANSSINDPRAQFDLLQKELTRLYDIEKNGGWNKIVLTKKYYTKGQSSPEIKEVKQHLQLLGYLSSKDDSPLFTDELSQAVRKAKRSFGQVETGVIDADLIKALNVPIENRIEQLEVNIDRFRNMSQENTGTRLVANIPEFKLHVYEGQEHVFDMAIVVGREGKETVTFNDEMKYIVFCPYWNVPTSIVQEEIIPAMRKNKNYLNNNNYEVTGTEGGLQAIRQRPGPGNSLGLVKFVFPNSHGIYFHDTPMKSLFKLQKRTFSHGCIRLAEPVKLATYLLRNDPGWTEEKIKAAMNTGKEQRVNLSTPVPVIITYLTAWVDDTGLLNMRDDIYGLDKEAAKKLVRTAKL